MQVCFNAPSLCNYWDTVSLPEEQSRISFTANGLSENSGSKLPSTSKWCSRWWLPQYCCLTSAMQLSWEDPDSFFLLEERKFLEFASSFTKTDWIFQAGLLLKCWKGGCFKDLITIFFSHAEFIETEFRQTYPLRSVHWSHGDCDWSLTWSEHKLYSGWRWWREEYWCHTH